MTVAAQAPITTTARTPDGRFTQHPERVEQERLWRRYWADPEFRRELDEQSRAAHRIAFDRWSAGWDSTHPARAEQPEETEA